MENNKITDVVLVRTEGQDALYMDGRKVSNDGVYNLPDYIDGIVVCLQFRHRLACDQEWEDNVGMLPENYKELMENEEDHRNG